MSLADWRHQSVNLIRSSAIGTWIGILPGVGANVGSVVSYTAAKQLSKEGDKFGTGIPDGIVASEAANNATIGGALVPLVAMGIPGSINDAILIGALIIHGIQPGPLLFVNNAPVVYAIITTAFVANAMMYLIMVGSVPFVMRIVDIPKCYLLPVISVFCVIGSFAVGNKTFDVWTMVSFGVIGFLMEKAEVPLNPFVIGIVLAPIAEEYLRSGLMMSNGSFMPLVTRPISAICLILTLMLLLVPALKSARQFIGAKRGPDQGH
jgi:putative tricarboxylic transport membrane protein